VAAGLTFLEWLELQGDREQILRALKHTSIGGPRSRVELVSTGIDESLQLTGGVGGGVSWEGLRVPFAPFAPPNAQDRFIGVGNYLFCAFYFELGAGERKRIRGLRLMNKIGLDVGPGPPAAEIPLELFVRTPTWRFRDGWVTYHLREIQPTILNRLRLRAGPFDTNTLSFRMAKAPALLYEQIHFPAAHLGGDGKPDYYVFLDGYVPPNAGRPYGENIADLGTIYDSTRFPWDSFDAWHSCDAVVEGGENTAVAGFIVVHQTNPRTRPVLPGIPAIPTGLPQEEQFLLDYPGAITWRVGMAAIVEDV
jgi:hypothetical protein